MPDTGPEGLNFGLGGKLAVVTGGAHGIGFAAARLLAANGASVWIFDLECERPQDAAQRIGARWCAADVTGRASLDAAFAAAGAPDIVIANAGIAREAAFCDQTAEDWERTVSVNLTGMARRQERTKPNHPATMTRERRERKERRRRRARRARIASSKA